MSPKITRTALLRELAKPLFLAGLALFLWRLVEQGRLSFYVSRQFLWLIVPTIPILLFIALSYFSRIATLHGCACGAHDSHNTWWGLGLAAVPLLLGLVLPPAPPGAATLVTRQGDLSALASAPSARSSQPLTRDGDRNLLDWVLAFQSAGDLSSFANQQVHLSGFVYRQNPMKAGDFFVTRFVVTCCVADAVAAGLLVRWPKGTALAQDQWIDVQGYLDVAVVDGEQQPVIVAERVTPIERPSQPYLNP